MSEGGAYLELSLSGTRKVDIRLPEKGNPNSHGARAVCQNYLDD
jgi:hypothetical protein